MNDDRDTSDPGAAAADHVRRWLDSRIEEIERGELEAAREAARIHSWRERIDMAGVPEDVLETVEVFVDTAWDALRDPAMSLAAVNALRQARTRLGSPELRSG